MFDTFLVIKKGRHIGTIALISAIVSNPTLSVEKLKNDAMNHQMTPSKATEDMVTH